ncbi:MAG: hypothetical protein BWY75_03706 [bacterium ADurb.Bin425]|nr:MAG: hypothetical protein BWY75_03706 [bacterium ADurb.Bin425]
MANHSDKLRLKPFKLGFLGNIQHDAVIALGIF